MSLWFWSWREGEGVAGPPVFAGSSTWGPRLRPSLGWWSGGGDGRWVGRGRPQRLPALGPGPAGWQVEHEASTGGCDAAWDVDDLLAQRGPAGGVHACGDGGGASEVERDDRAGDPGGVGGVLPRGQV